MESLLFALLIGAFIVKHTIADFIYQPEFQWKNKGTYGHPGGIVHSLQHVALSAIIMGFIGVIFPWLLLFEFLVHYHTDWLKMNLNKHFGWKAETHSQFWILTGLDQMIHMLTYVAMVFVMVRIG